MSALNLALLSSVKVPRNNTAAMQLLQLYAQSGHYYWTAGVVSRKKLNSFVCKLESYRISRDAPGRAYDKTKGLASVHLVILDSADDVLPWVLVSTAGKGGLAAVDVIAPGEVRDTRLAGQHLTWGHYELLRAEKRITRTRDVKTRDGQVLKDRKETIKQTTWSWRLSAARVKAHEALIVALAKQRDSTGLDAELEALARMPQFSGVRGQVLKLYGEAKKLAGKFKLDPPLVPDLPYMVRQPAYGEPPKTLLTLLNNADENASV